MRKKTALIDKSKKVAEKNTLMYSLSYVHAVYNYILLIYLHVVHILYSCNNTLLFKSTGIYTPEPISGYATVFFRNYLFIRIDFPLRLK